MTDLHFQSVKGKAREILRAILQTSELSSCGMKDAMLLRLACEEIVMNITSYAYPDVVGHASERANPVSDSDFVGHASERAIPVPDDTSYFLNVQIEKADNRIVIRFIDGGIPFNPLDQSKPDTKLSWKRRQIGGLGIFLVLKKMDAVRYAYEDNKNVLTIENVLLEACPTT